MLYNATIKSSVFLHENKRIKSTDHLNTKLK